VHTFSGKLVREKCSAHLHPVHTVPADYFLQECLRPIGLTVFHPGSMTLILFFSGYFFDLISNIFFLFQFDPKMTDNSQTYHLKTLFSNYEKSFLMENLSQYIQIIKRNLPHSTFPTTPPFMNTDHVLLQFESTQASHITAYELFPLQVMLWHTFSPSELFFTAT
jgi:hypothetical protein